MNQLERPQNNPWAPYWLVGDKKIYNQFEAQRLAFVDRGPAYRFVFLEDSYDKLNWTKEPDCSWEELCVERAVALRQKYKKLKLLFSAGRDSGHVWNVFEKAGIPIDELVLIYSAYHPLRVKEYHEHIYPKAVELCRKHPGMKIRTLCLEKDQFEYQIKNSDWIDGTNSRQGRTLFLPHHFGYVLTTMDPEYMDSGTGYICGMEKPTIRLIDNNYAFSHLDVSLEWWATDMPNMEWFYWAPEQPEIFLKQCWMLVNHLEKNYPNATPEFLREFQNPYSVYYDEFCKSVGRGSAMIWETGNGVQKCFDNYHWAIQSVIKTAEGEDWKSYKEWKLIMEDLKRNWAHCFNDHDPYKGSIGIWGKPYFIKQQSSNNTVNIAG
jgi:hypothetical protein